MNTNKRRGLGDSKYNVRRAECEKALEELQEGGLNIKSLGELTEEQFEETLTAIEEFELDYSNTDHGTIAVCGARVLLIFCFHC